MLERAGFEIVEVADGESALQAFAADPDGFALALLDITLPTIDGITVLERLPTDRPALPVVLSSGWSGDEVAEAVLRDASTRLLGKPYRPEDLVATIEAVLAAEATAMPG